MKKIQKKTMREKQKRSRNYKIIFENNLSRSVITTI